MSSTTVTAVTPANASGPTDVVLTTNGGSATKTNGFVYGAPTVTAISPNAGTTLGGTSVTITGTGFATGATVTIGGTAATGVDHRQPDHDHRDRPGARGGHGGCRRHDERRERHPHRRFHLQRAADRHGDHPDRPARRRATRV